MAWFGAGILAIFAAGSRPITAVRMAEVGRRHSSAAASIRARPSCKERSLPLLCKADAGRVMLTDAAGNEERREFSMRAALTTTLVSTTSLTRHAARLPLELALSADRCRRRRGPRRSPGGAIPVGLW